MRLQPEGAPDAMHGRRSVADLLGHGPQAPVRGAFGKRLQRLADRRGDGVVADLARRPGAGLVVEAVHAAPGKAIAPGAGGRRANPHLGGHFLVVEAARRGKNDPRPLRQRLRRPVLACQRHQLAFLRRIQ